MMMRALALGLTYVAAIVVCTARPARADGGNAGSGPPPARVDNRVDESQLTTVHLTERAEKRLGIRTARVERRSVRRSRVYPAEVMIPPGRAVLLAAPASGAVGLPPERTTGPQPGMQVSAGNVLYVLTTSVGGDASVLAAADRISIAKARADLLAAQVEAEARLREAKVQVDASSVRLERARTLKRDNAGSQRSFDDALAENQMSQAMLVAANERSTALRAALAELEAGHQAAIPITSPLSGVIRAIHVAPGEAVPAAAPICEVVALNRLWLRAPVYVGELDRLDAAADAQVRELTGDPRSGSIAASPVHPAGSADPAAATVDLFYEVDNSNGRFKPGQRLSVAIPMLEEADGLLVPYSAVLYDIHGGAWVYQRSAPLTYVRTRIEIRDVDRGMARLARGPSPGAEVVTAGAAELFGTEFGAGK